jgi:hypothetical protein
MCDAISGGREKYLSSYHVRQAEQRPRLRFMSVT